MQQPECPPEPPPPPPPPIASSPIVGSTGVQQQDGAKPQVALDDRGHISEDVQCRMCSYNLRGLSPDMCCPECATPAGLSIHGDLLQYANPRWVKQLASGAFWMILSFFLVIGVELAVEAINALANAFLLRSIVGLIPGAVELVAFWKLTQREPGRIEESPIWNVRQMLRLLAVAGLASEAMVPARVLLPVLGAGLYTPIGLWVSVILMLAGKILLLILLRRLALRIPSDQLASRTMIVMWGFIASYAVSIATTVAFATLVFLWWIPPPSVGLTVGIKVVTAYPILVSWILLIILLFQYRAAFRRSARTALKSWSQHVPGAS